MRAKRQHPCHCNAERTLDRPGARVYAHGQPPWAAQGAALVERVAGSKVLSNEVMAEIVERTDGIPLFVEDDGTRRSFIGSWRRHSSPIRIESMPNGICGARFAKALLEELG